MKGKEGAEGACLSSDFNCWRAGGRKSEDKKATQGSVFVIGFQLLESRWEEIGGQESDAGSSFPEVSAMPSRLGLFVFTSLYCSLRTNAYYI
ncbi:hypothetical protein ASD24_22930 [Paenibacillus sp. Root52]|uniref:hypothetical protein n=1 Tax=Paenibacillus sp. Root52 TaxID=1736552 RepID=UPI0006FFEFB2|nr:hypothetical protein [Paenibacillus sp. Root52]KQY91594.1 hypothetical protein ASD24_22930 [Paenibacillus sp. Root52]